MTLSPTQSHERQLTLDVLRGVAILGILVINVQLMASPRLVRAIFGDSADVSPLGTALEGMIGVFVAGKFISSFSILFGVGAALIAARALAHGRAPRRILARRYGLLIVAGLAHMLLLFPGDVLFIYGLTGLVLLAFLTRTDRTIAIWAGLLLTVMTVAFSTLLVTQQLDSTTNDAGFTSEALQAAATGEAAYQAYDWAGVVTWNGLQSAVIQSDALVSLPWFLALFMLGMLAYRRGYALNPAEKRNELAHMAKVAVPVGIVLNLPLAFTGAFGTATVLADTPLWLLAASGVAQIIGAPLLAVGYLSALTLLVLNKGATSGIRRRLGALGRIALTGYLLQSIASFIVFFGFRQYGRFNTFSEPLLLELVFVAGVWTALLLFAPWWTARFRFGPFEWLWRWGTYGTRPLLRNDPTR